jgi:sugar lactone lactonase YvrE
MQQNYRAVAFVLFALSGALIGTTPALPQTNGQLDTVVAANQQMNGVAVAPDGRVFVGMPRWVQLDGFSVGLVKNGTVQPYPGGSWNTWKEGLPPAEHFISVNAVRIEPDDRRNLWVVDPAAGVKGAPKLVQIDLSTNKVARVYSMDANIAPAMSYLNDVRIARGHAFITESGMGAVIVVDLATGRARRLLANSTKTKAVPGRTPVIDGRKVLRPDGTIPIVNADGIEISPDHASLYFCNPYGGFLWQVSVDDLLNEKLDDATLDKRVKNLGPLIPVGGILMLPNGNLLLSDVEKHAIELRTPDGKLTMLRESKLLDWPDAMSLGTDGKVYVAAAQANRRPASNSGRDDTTRPFRILSFTLPK